MSAIPKSNAHVVDVLSNVIGRDQPILKMEKALEMVSVLGDEVFLSDDVVFFDPFCKAGELLLSSAYMTCLMKTKKETKLMPVKRIYNEIFDSGKYFALSPDERHHKISLRTFLGNENSHKAEYNHIIKNGNYLSEIDGTLDLDAFKREFESMIEYIKETTKVKRIIAVGNPPYQEDYKSSKTNTGANLIYHHFIDAIVSSGKVDEFVLVIPSRWFAGGRGKKFKDFFKDLRCSKKIKQIYDFKNSKTVFPTVDIKGGVCFLHWDKMHNGLTKFISNEEGTSEAVDLSKGDIVIRERQARTIVAKVERSFKEYMSDIAWSWNPYNLPSNYFKKNVEDSGRGVIECMTMRGNVKKILKSKIVKNKETISLFKVAYPKAISKGGVPHRADQILILKPNQVCTETYMIVDVFEKEEDAKKLKKYLGMDIVRFLVSQKKITQDMTKDTWKLVPKVDLSKIKNENDFCVKLKLTKEEKDYIYEKVKEWS